MDVNVTLAKTDPSPVYLALNSTADYDRLCTLDVLGLADNPTGDQGNVCDEFKEQLTRSPEGMDETALPWKGNHPPLPNNKEGSMYRLNSPLRKLQRTNMLSQYDAVIREQLEEGVVERELQLKQLGKNSICHTVQLYVRTQKRPSYEWCKTFQPEHIVIRDFRRCKVRVPQVAFE